MSWLKLPARQMAEAQLRAGYRERESGVGDARGRPADFSHDTIVRLCYSWQPAAFCLRHRTSLFAIERPPQC